MPEGTDADYRKRSIRCSVEGLVRPLLPHCPLTRSQSILEQRCQAGAAQVGPYIACRALHFFRGYLIGANRPAPELQRVRRKRFRCATAGWLLAGIDASVKGRLVGPQFGVLVKGWGSRPFRQLLRANGQAGAAHVEDPSVFPDTFLKGLPQGGALGKHGEMRAAFGLLKELHGCGCWNVVGPIAEPEMIPNLLGCYHGHRNDSVRDGLAHVVEEMAGGYDR